MSFIADFFFPDSLEELAGDVAINNAVDQTLGNAMIKKMIFSSLNGIVTYMSNKKLVKRKLNDNDRKQIYNKMKSSKFIIHKPVTVIQKSGENFNINKNETDFENFLQNLTIDAVLKQNKKKIHKKIILTQDSINSLLSQFKFEKQTLGIAGGKTRRKRTKNKQTRKCRQNTTK